MVKYFFGNFYTIFAISMRNEYKTTTTTKRLKQKNAKFSKNAKWLFIEKRNVAFNNKAIKKSGSKIRCEMKKCCSLLWEEENK